MERFRIKNESNNVVYKSATLIDCVNWVKSNEPGLNAYYIEDVVDDIEIDADEVVLAFDEGERYTDLQGF